MNVVFRVDASTQIGSGHVMRCLTLAEQLKKRNANICFICRELDGNLINLIYDYGYIVYTLPQINSEKFRDIFNWYECNWEKDSLETISILNTYLQKVDFIIVDHYGLDEKWEIKLKTFVKKIFVIDDLANRRHFCDILLDQNLYSNYQERYKGLVPINCKQLLGPNYVLLREEFLKASNNRIRDGKIRKILVFFGGTDPTNETKKALHALSDIDRSIKINVVVGSSNSKKKEIYEICNRFHNFTFYCQVSNMAELMESADLAIGAGGTATWERCFFGLPSVTIIVAKNQYGVTTTLGKYGATINLNLSHEVKPNTIKETVADLINHPSKVKLLSENASKIIDKSMVRTYPVVKAILEEI
jgi:UDP-2,4-diacetamido-2,4,6-trideoxy-beta-L-altropyranose hydrolase